MKKLFFYATMLLLATACKKEGGPGKPLLLSKVYSDNLLSVEYKYSLDRQPIRRDYYATSQGQSVFQGYRVYGYENGLMSEVLFYNDDNHFLDKMTISRDATGTITRVDRMGTDDEIDFYWLFQYDANDHLSKLVQYTTSPTKKAGEWLIETDMHDRIVSLRRYWQNAAVLTLTDSARFTYGDVKPLPAEWDYYEMLATDFPIDYTFFQMAANSIYYYMPGAPPTHATHTLTEKKYNGAGLLSSQAYDLSGQNAVSAFSSSHQLKYEYIE